MTKEEIRERMFVLCMYAPYGLKVKHDLQDFPCELQSIDLYRGSVECVPIGEKAYLGTQHCLVEFVKPILRSMRSMNKNDEIIYYQRVHDVGRAVDVIDCDDIVPHIKWLIKNSYDFMNLIPRGLAVDEKTIRGGQYE